MLPNQTQVATTANETPNLGDNHETHVEGQEGQSNPKEADGRGRKWRKKHPRPQPSGRAQPAPQSNSDAHMRLPLVGYKVEGIIQDSLHQTPRVIVPNPNDHDEEPTEYQYHSEDLYTLPGSDSDDENPVFPQHNSDTKFGKIRLELGMEFGTMEQFKDAFKKYSIQMGREAFFLKVEPHRCRVIYYNKTCPWLVYCARRNQPPSYQIKTLVDEHTCPRSNRSRLVTCKWVSEELISKIRVCPNLSHREVRDLFKVEFDICVGERMMFRVMEKAKDQETWSGSRFSTWPKVDNITNNKAESLNATMMVLKGKSIIIMLEDIKYYLIKTIATHKDALMTYTEKLAPIQTSRLEKEKKKGNYWKAQ
ncbi:hypothetical protein Ahy_B10g101711 [Arachis hypogaea]|uniref:Uncharacterized protein n=1 Tax=Arachis hypogaea TaxID=3818 RepID=A0A444X056_ARAHY|nr:hypothetical protein Ahy_B10g101711 [Arachis hypogaea]